MPFLPGQVSPGEAVLGQSRALAAAATGGLDAQHRLLPVFDRVHTPYARGVEAMAFGPAGYDGYTGCVRRWRLPPAAGWP